MECLYQPFPMARRRGSQIWRYAHEYREYRRPHHFHAEPELNLVVTGSAAFQSGEVSIAVAAGDLLCWPPRA